MFKYNESSVLNEKSIGKALRITITMYQCFSFSVPSQISVEKCGNFASRVPFEVLHINLLSVNLSRHMLGVGF